MICCPPWLEKMQREACAAPSTRICYNRFYIRAAGLSFSPSGRLEDLAVAVGVARSTLIRAYADTHGLISPELAIAIEKAVGPSVITRQILRPDFFV